jgi:hypothetical protein
MRFPVPGDTIGRTYLMNYFGLMKTRRLNLLQNYLRDIKKRQGTTSVVPQIAK